MGIWGRGGLCRGAAPAPAREVERLLTGAVQLIEAAIATIAQAAEISVNWFVSFDQVVAGREIATHMRSGDVILARGRETGVREFFSTARSPLCRAKTPRG